MLGITIRMAQGIGLHAAYKEADLTDHEKERRRRIWYCLFILDRLVALQLGGAVMVRDTDFSVELPSTALNGDLSEVSYLCHVVGLSRVISLVIDHLYRPAQTVIRLEQLLETIGFLDRELLDWRDKLPAHLRFDHAHPFETNAIFKRQVKRQSSLSNDSEKLPWNQIPPSSHANTSALPLP
jgi:Fungal specific transcription factor domain